MQDKFFFKSKEFLIHPTVYGPREDSFLLAESVKATKGSKVFDLGCGTGIQGINALMQGAKKVVFADININAVKCATTNAETAGFAGKFEAVHTELFENIKGKFDGIVFNPPYVPSEEKKWADTDGGEKGREVLDVFLQEFPTHLKTDGGCFFLQSSLNGEKETAKILEERGFTGTIVARKGLFFEELIVFKAFKKQ